jgi:hypothetical protein
MGIPNSMRILYKTFLEVFEQLMHCLIVFQFFLKPVSPNSSLKYLIFAISPILIMSDFENTTLEYGAGIAKSVQWLATGWTVWDLNPSRGKRFYNAQNRPDHRWGPPSLLLNGYEGTFLWVQQPWHVVDHSPPPSIEVNSEWSYISAPLYAFIPWAGTAVPFLSF